jgi:hypothetical protein
LNNRVIESRELCENQKFFHRLLYGSHNLRRPGLPDHQSPPQGEVAPVRQVVVKFDDSAVNFGDPKAPAPLSLSCSDAQATRGAGRWISDRQSH